MASLHRHCSLHSLSLKAKDEARSQKMIEELVVLFSFARKVGVATEASQKVNTLTMDHLLLCPSFDVQRQDLLAEIAELLRPVVQTAHLSNDALTQLLLHGDNDLSNNLNRSILELTLSFIYETGRFD